MPSFRRHRAVVPIILAASSAWASLASAQHQNPLGFAVERFYRSAPGAGWLVMDALDMHGGLGGTAELTTGYARSPLRVSAGPQRSAVVGEQAFTNLGFAGTYDRWRLYVDLDVPLMIRGQGGLVGDYNFLAPAVDVASKPDTLADVRIGIDTRIFGGPASPFRLGAGAQLFVPSGNRADYDTDGTYRAMARALFAGDIGHFAYAGHVGVHVRPLDDSPTPGSPQGSELLFGVAGGPKLRLCHGCGTAFVVGPEVFGATAFRSFFGSTGTALEGLLTARLEGTADDGPQLRIKLGAGAGLDQRFGAPEWRLAFAIEIFDHRSDSDKDGISDANDACPRAPGPRTEDPKTTGCPAASLGVEAPRR